MGFPAFGPIRRARSNRGSYAGYIDLEADVVEDVLVGVAGRYEDYEVFGDTLNGKVAARWQATDSFAFRGSVSTGFRAPTVGQSNVRNVSTNLNDKGELADVATLPPTSPIAKQKGGRPLAPEKSVNISTGMVFEIGGLAVTIDYYNIKVKDRIAQTSGLNLTKDDIDALLAQGVADASSFSQVRFFTNDFDTTTQGIDVVATYPAKMLGGDTTFTFAGNWNQTKVDAFNPDIIHREKVRQLEEGLPEFRFSLTADHRRGPWRFLSRLHYYDAFVEFFFAGSGLPPINASERWLVDAEASYTFKSGLTLAAGAENLFNTYPTENPNATILGNKYPSSSPFGFNGGFYYLGISYAF